MRSRKSHDFLYCIIFLPAVICDLVQPETSGANHYDRSCLDLLEDYAAQTSNFTKCFIEHARPITVCQNCVQLYMNVVESYENITRYNGDIPGEFCKAELMNVDRLEVIVDSFNYVRHLWEKALCSKCFKNHSTVLNDETTNLLRYLEVTNNCINNTNHTSHSNDKICKDCYQSYFKLNYYYDNQGSYTAFCMDIIDAMNSSRVEWSVTLGCCTDRQKPEILFLMTVILALSAPILFYLSVWFYSKRYPTRTRILNFGWIRRFLQMPINN